MTILFYIKESKSDLVRFVLEKGANINHQDDQGNTLLHSIVKNVEFEDPKNLLYILKKDGNPLIKNNAGLDVFEYFQKLPFSNKDASKTNEILKKWKAEYEAKILKENLPKGKILIRSQKI